MTSHDEILERVLNRVSDQVVQAVKETVADTVRAELSAAMNKALAESEFYRTLNDEMRTGLQGIYQEISTVATPADATDTGKTQKLFSEAGRQIEEVIQTTLEATEQIMAAAEGMQEKLEEIGGIIAVLPVPKEHEKDLARLDTVHREFEATISDVVTALSFQDLTGQRLKKVTSALESIRGTVFDLYVSTGLMLKSHEAAPEKDIKQMAEESRKTVEEIKGSELKGPSSSANQADVDDLLASLGL